MSASASQKICSDMVSITCVDYTWPSCKETYLHIQQFKNSGVVKSKDTLKDEDVWRVNGGSPVETSMFLKRVDRNLCALATLTDTMSPLSLYVTSSLNIESENLPSLEILQPIYQDIKVQCLDIFHCFRTYLLQNYNPVTHDNDRLTSGESKSYSFINAFLLDSASKLL